MPDSEESNSEPGNTKPLRKRDDETIIRPQSSPHPDDFLIESQETDRSQAPSVLDSKLKFDRRNTERKFKDPMRLPIGAVYDDFLIRQEIGRGAFGVVYLAEQLSLSRTVALKITNTQQDDGCCAEGQTMAQLEHPSIVQVFAQSTDDTLQRRLLCMQYVPGINLRSLLKLVQDRYGDNWNGSSLLAILEEGVDKENLVLRDTSVADRNALATADKLAAVCWIGAQVSFALNHAHQAGYIHHDIKPDNTIINRFGRPMLVDFNLAMETQMTHRPIQGGTVPYMSPNSICDFASDNQTKSTLGFEADIYALGVMLWELACGTQPFEGIGAESFGNPERLNALLASRKQSPQSDLIPPRLAACLRIAICFDATQRYQSASELGHALLGVAKQDSALKSRSQDTWFARMVLRRPGWCFVIAAFASHLIASALQIAYNQAEIISRLTPSAYQLFNILLFCVNPILYTACTWFVLKYLRAILKPWSRLDRGLSVATNEVELARRNLMLFPKRVAIIGGLGWLGGVIGFPGIIYLFAQQFSLDVWLHFILSFAISGAIAVTFSYALVLAVAVYSIYPILFANPARFIDESKRQLKPIHAAWPKLSMVAGLIPLGAAILVVAYFHPDDLLPTPTNPYREIAFKGLVIGLILSSAFGFEFVRRVGKSVRSLIGMCTD